MRPERIVLIRLLVSVMSGGIPVGIHRMQRLGVRHLVFEVLDRGNLPMRSKVEGGVGMQCCG